MILNWNIPVIKEFKAYNCYKYLMSEVLEIFVVQEWIMNNC